MSDWIETERPFNRSLKYLEDLNKVYTSALESRIAMLTTHQKKQQASAYRTYKHTLEALLDLMQCSRRFDQKELERLFNKLENTPTQLKPQKFNPDHNRHVKTLKNIQRDIAKMFAKGSAMDITANKTKSDEIMAQTLK